MAKRKKKRLVKTVVFTITVCIIVTLIFNYGRDIYNNTSVHYTSFGINVPRKYSIHGIDVSRYQGRIKWSEVVVMTEKELRLGFVFIKATEGKNYLDPYFERNWKLSKKHLMVRGAYHYFHPAVDPIKQAEFFIRHVKISTGDMPPVIDIEETNGLTKQDIVQRLQTMVDVLEEHYGVKPILYTGAHFYKRYLSEQFHAYPLWIAHYKTAIPRVSREWQFWQHSETGRVNGIKGYVDFNVFDGDSTQFKNLLVP